MFGSYLDSQTRLTYVRTYLVMMVSARISQDEEAGLVRLELRYQDCRLERREDGDVVHGLRACRVIVEHDERSSFLERGFGEVVVADGWFGEGCFCVFVEDTGVFCCRRGWWHFWGVL